MEKTLKTPAPQAIIENIQLVLFLAKAGYYDHPVTKAIVVLDQRIKEIEQLSGVPTNLFDVQLHSETIRSAILYPAGYENFINGLIKEVFLICDDIALLKEIQSQMLDVFLKTHGGDPIVKLARYQLSGSELPDLYHQTQNQILGFKDREELYAVTFDDISVYIELLVSVSGDYTNTLQRAHQLFSRVKWRLTPVATDQLAQTMAKGMLAEIEGNLECLKATVNCEEK